MGPPVAPSNVVLTKEDVDAGKTKPEPPDPNKKLILDGLLE
jgi:hypothetical protein